MRVLPRGHYQIQCVLIDNETVLNNEGVQWILIENDHWLIQPAGQRFKISSSFRQTAMLKSNGHTYVAEFGPGEEPDTILIQLKRERVMQTISIEAKMIQAAADLMMSEAEAEIHG